MNGTAATLQNYDDAFEHAWDSVLSVLDGVSEDEAVWQPDCYAGEAQEPGLPPAGTIRWQVVHLAQCKRYYVECLACRPQMPPDSPSRPAGASLADDIEELRAAHRQLRMSIASVSDAALDEMIGKLRVGERIASFIRHDSWHAGQMAVVRRMWKRRK